MRRHRLGMLLLWASMSTACGRVGFDPQSVGDGGLDSSAGDGGSDGATDSGAVDGSLDGGDGGVTLPPGLYRSVGPGTSAALATGAGNALTLVEGVATFELPMPDRVGVGDALSYDSNDDGMLDAIAFVHHRHSATELVVATERGGLPVHPPTATTQWELHRAYLGLADAVEGTTNPSITVPFDAWADSLDVVALGQSWHIACYGDAVDRGARNVRVVGWTSSAAHYLRIFAPMLPQEVGQSQRHAGAWDTGKYVLASASDTNDLVLSVDDVNVRVEGLQIFVDSDGLAGDLQYGILLNNFTAGRIGRVSHNLIRSSDLPRNPAFPRGVMLDAAEPGPIFHVWNNVIYDFGGEAEARGVELVGQASTAYLYNNTFVNVFPAVFANMLDQRVVLRNNLAVDCSTQCFGWRDVYEGGNNLCSGTEPFSVAALLSSDQPTDYFRSASDLRLSPSAPGVAEVRDQGMDLSGDAELRFSDDVEGQPRTVPWDVGADEL